MKSLKISTLLLTALMLSAVSCDAVLEPEWDYHSTDERLYGEPAFAEGVLLTAYLRIPFNDATADRRNGYTEMATDDAVASNRTNAFLKLGTGEWTAKSSNAYISQWSNLIRGITYANKFLTMIDEVAWKPSNPTYHAGLKHRFTGESYAIRGILKYHLLQTVGGYSNDNELLGFPDYDDLYGEEVPEEEFNRPRMTFAQSLESIYKDFDEALKYLPYRYRDVSSKANVPAGFEKFVDGYETTSPDFAAFNKVFGNGARQRIDGRIIQAYQARTALLAASPAFNPTNDKSLWEKAAVFAGELIKTRGAILNQDKQINQTRKQNDGYRWFSSDYDGIAADNDRDIECIWRRPKSSIANWAQDNYPPGSDSKGQGFYGNGLVNPSQNLVDAFPMKNGYPITHASANYNPQKPYNSRDTRLPWYIVCDGLNSGNNRPNGKVCYTRVGSGQTAKDSISTSTRTGYYMMKNLRHDYNFSSTSKPAKNSYVTLIRVTEMYLLFAEAANEAWGAQADPKGFGFTAYDIIDQIRVRAGVNGSSTNSSGVITEKTDPYLDEVAGDVTKFRELVRNERRIELCFEGFRFWDLRRWLLPLDETVRGVNINKNATVYDYVDVEKRVYDNNYMHYGPIPFNDILRYNKIKQNKGW